jgi:hypothetical protein
MAKGRKTGGRNWKKGETGNAKGAPKVPEDIKEARRLNGPEFDRIANKLLAMTKAEIVKIVNEPTTPSLDLIVASVIHKAIIEGDAKRLDYLLCRTIGKVVQPVQHAGPDGGPIPVQDVTNLTPEERLARLKKMQVRLNRTLGHEK